MAISLGIYPTFSDKPKLVIFLSSVLLGIHTTPLLYFWYVSWVFPSRGESPIYMHTHTLIILQAFAHVPFWGFWASPSSVCWEMIPDAWVMLNSDVYHPCTYEMDRTSIHGKKPAALSVFSDELGWWDSQNSLWTVATWAQVTAFCLWRMVHFGCFFFFPHRSAYWSKAVQHPLPLRSFPLSPRAVSQVHGGHSWVPRIARRSTFGADF